jgi:acyl carrier protein
MRATLRQILSEHGNLPLDVNLLSDEADLYQAGLTSHACVKVMLALEEAFDIEFPDELLSRATFESVTSMSEVLTDLWMQPPDAVR